MSLGRAGIDDRRVGAFQTEHLGVGAGQVDATVFGGQGARLGS